MRVLVTGGNGFLGAWIIRRLLRRGLDVRVFDLVEDRRLATMVVGDDARRVQWSAGDIRSGAAVGDALSGCGAVVHLAGMLTSGCRQDPVRGAEVNLVGTLNVFEAAKRQGLNRVVYASSAGVFGPEDGAVPHPITHYGAFKLACEGSARAYWHDEGIASIGFRPFIVYGPGRETGATAGPSLACRAAALGERYVMPYTGTADMIHVDDVAAAFEMAAVDEWAGAHAFNLLGEVASTDRVGEEIRRVVPGADIGAEGPSLPFAATILPGDVERLLPGLPRTPLAEGLAATIDFYRARR